jgi:hypothetical protein
VQPWPQGALSSRPSNEEAQRQSERLSHWQQLHQLWQRPHGRAISAPTPCRTLKELIQTWSYRCWIQRVTRVTAAPGMWPLQNVNQLTLPAPLLPPTPAFLPVFCSRWRIVMGAHAVVELLCPHSSSRPSSPRARSSSAMYILFLSNSASWPS